MSRGKRRLAGILAADVVGYSAMIAADEPAGLARVRALRTDIVEPAAAAHDGRLFKTMGDGFLLEFASAVQALQCAIAIQTTLNAQTDGLRLRIGVHQGEVVPEGDDLFGDGVIIAARLEPLADHGGIVISSRVKEDASGKMTLEVDDLGEPELKNIAAKIRAFRVRLEGGHAAAVRPTLALPDKPSIAVLPFQNMSGDPEQVYFVDGMVEDIITGLSRIKWLFVIARNSTFVYKGRATDVKQVGRELGVRYVLEGSVRKVGNQVRVTGQLIDAADATHVWAERYDRALDDIFALQDELTISVVGAIEPSLRQAEIERARRKRPENLDAYDLYLRALPNVFTSMPQTADQALQSLERAIAIEPDYAVAHAMIAWCHHARYQRGGLREETKRAALRHARVAIAAGGDDATALAVAAFVIGANDLDYQTAFNAFDRALALSPSSALAFSFSSLIHAFAGDDAITVDQAVQALRLSPFDSLIYVSWHALSCAHMFAGRFEQAALAASRCEQANPRFSPACLARIAALVNLGRNDDARAVVQRLLALSPDFAISHLPRFTSPERLAMLADALRQIGLPEN